MARKRRFDLDEKTGKILYQLALLGHTVEEMAGVLGISPSLLKKRLREQDAIAKIAGDESILTLLKKGRDIADGAVVEALYRRAVGFRLGEGYYPPDVTAAIFWLKNRQPGRWRDVQKTETSVELKKAPPSLTIVIEDEKKGKK